MAAPLSPPKTKSVLAAAATAASGSSRSRIATPGLRVPLARLTLHEDAAIAARAGEEFDRDLEKLLRDLGTIESGEALESLARNIAEEAIGDAGGDREQIDPHPYYEWESVRDELVDASLVRC